MKIVITGGGTGGHILPLLAVAKELKKITQDQKLELFYVGPKIEIENIAFSQLDIKKKIILAGKLRRYISIKSIFINTFDMLKMLIGIIQAFFIFLFSRPKLVFSKGGYGSFPVIVAAKLLGIPVFLHESDAIQGLANKVGSFFADRIFVAFSNLVEMFPGKKVYWVGNPVREELLNGDKEEADVYFSITKTKPVIFIVGGSQGAQRINEMFLNTLAEFCAEYELIHQCGKDNLDVTKRAAEMMLPDHLKSFYHLYGFLSEEQMKNALAACDVVISRAGAGSIFEIAAAGKPSILIPLPESAQNHQFQNAYLYAKDGAAIVLEEGNFSQHMLLQELEKLFNNPELLAKMSLEAKKFAKPDAAKQMAEYIKEFIVA